MGVVTCRTSASEHFCICAGKRMKICARMSDNLTLRNQKGGEIMYAKLLSGKKALAPAEGGTCSPCGGVPVPEQLQEEPICFPSGYVDGYC